MRRLLRENGLGLFFLVSFLLALVGQSIAGQRAFNADQREHGEAALSYARYLVSPSFGGAVMENWQSEFLQFSLFILATIWLTQKGSNESKVIERAGLESDREQRVGGYAPENAPRLAKLGPGARRWLYENSLLLAMTGIFFATWFTQSLNNWKVYNADQHSHGGAPVRYGRYLLNADFWERSLQNWQSEFLAVATMVLFTIYLRQRGSPESKPVGAPHDETATSG